MTTENTHNIQRIGIQFGRSKVVAFLKGSGEPITLWEDEEFDNVFPLTLEKIQERIEELA